MNERLPNGIPSSRMLRHHSYQTVIKMYCATSLYGYANEHPHTTPLDHLHRNHHPVQFAFEVFHSDAPFTSFSTIVSHSL